MAYTNDKMYKDIYYMYEEIKKPDEETKKLLDQAAAAWEESDRLGIPDVKADDCVNHFCAKYPLLAINCPHIFKVMLLKERYIDMDLVANALSLERAMNETKRISKHDAEIAFGKLMARKFFPTEAYKEVEEQMKDPEKVKQLRKEAERQAKN
jgi:hypothetical protein